MMSTRERYKVCVWKILCKNFQFFILLMLLFLITLHVNISKKPNQSVVNALPVFIKDEGNPWLTGRMGAWHILKSWHLWCSYTNYDQNPPSLQLMPDPDLTNHLPTYHLNKMTHWKMLESHALMIIRPEWDCMVQRISNQEATPQETDLSTFT